MGLTATIQKQIDVAFKTAGDLVKTVTIESKSLGEFDFLTQTQSEVVTSRVVKGILSDKLRKMPLRDGLSNATATHSITFRKREVGEIGMSDSLIIDNTTWKIAPPISENDFVVTAQIFKEA